MLCEGGPDLSYFFLIFLEGEGKKAERHLLFKKIVKEMSLRKLKIVTGSEETGGFLYDFEQIT